MKVYIAVGLGGIIGTVFRYLISLFFWSDQLTSFPWATFIANISGAFLLTWIIFQPYFVNRMTPTSFTGLTTGLIGSYTTFSTLILELTILFSHDWLLALLYLFLTVGGGLLSSYAGYILATIPSKREMT